jgi:Subtilase family
MREDAMRGVFSVLSLGVVVTMVGQLAVTPAASAGPRVPVRPGAARSCPSPGRPGVSECMAWYRVNARGAPDAASAVAGYGPADLRSAYALPSDRPGAVVAIVDAFDDPAAESDLATYRSEFGLPPCTTANGCFRKVNQHGQAGPLPGTDVGWAAEISLDVDMVSAVCPNCQILLVEANSNDNDNLYAAVNRAVGMGARHVSNSWGGPERSDQTDTDNSVFNHPGVAITASTGDSGIGPQYPATSRFVTAVGGTSLFRSSSGRGFTETAWPGAGSGCSAFDARAPWQNVPTGCGQRAEADVSAVADPNTGVAVFDTFGFPGWTVFGGTSAAAPIVAAVYALAGTPGQNDYPAAYPYSKPGSLFDVTGGSNGGCGAPLCQSGSGWDGPTGLGTPNGVDAFAPPPPRWDEVPDGESTVDTPAAATYGATEFLFVRGGNDRIYLNQFDGGSWTGWGEVPGGGLTPSAPAATPCLPRVPD